MSAVNIQMFEALVTFPINMTILLLQKVKIKVTVAHTKIQREIITIIIIIIIIIRIMSCGFIQMSASPKVNPNRRVYSHKVSSLFFNICSIVLVSSCTSISSDDFRTETIRTDWFHPPARQHSCVSLISVISILEEATFLRSFTLYPPWYSFSVTSLFAHFVHLTAGFA